MSASVTKLLCRAYLAVNLELLHPRHGGSISYNFLEVRRETVLAYWGARYQHLVVSLDVHWGISIRVNG